VRRVFLLVLPVFALLIPLGAGAAGAPVLAFSGGSGNYGTIDLGTTASQTFTLTNSGGVATASLKVSITGTGAAAFTKKTDTCSATSLGPKKVCSITVEYTPTSVHADDNATLTAMSKKPAASGSVALTGRGTNHAAVAGDDFVTTSEDTQLIFPKSQVLANDTDVDGDILHVAAGTETAPQHGTLSIGANSFFYTPHHDFTGTDSFTYRAADAFFGSVSNVATVHITVTPVNDAPVAGPNPYVTDEDTTLTLPSPGVLADDTDPDIGDVLSVATVNGSTADVGTTVTLASGALLTLNPDGSLSYDPNGAYEYLGPGEQATEVITYTATDGLLESNLTTVIVTVTGVNDAPVALDDDVSTDEDTPLTIPVSQLLANDTGDTLTITSVTDGAEGSALLANGEITYTPDENYHGGDTLTYFISDANGGFAFAHVSIFVYPVNDAPVANDDSYTLLAGRTLVDSVLANDTDVDGDWPLVTAILDLPSHGTASVLQTGFVVYHSDEFYTGVDTLTYTTRDPGGLSSTATVTINVIASDKVSFTLTDSHSRDTMTRVDMYHIPGDDDEFCDDVPSYDPCVAFYASGSRIRLDFISGDYRQQIPGKPFHYTCPGDSPKAAELTSGTSYYGTCETQSLNGDYAVTATFDG
jgi:VCBS repeat-containing protein